MQKAYEEALKDFRADIKSFCAKREANYVSVCTDVAIEKIMLLELMKAGLIK